jgi:uncharacterized FlaG/YvyC family protein
MDIPVTKPISGVPAAAGVPERPQPAASPSAPAVASPPCEAETVRELASIQQAIAEQVSRFLQTSERNIEFQFEGDAPVIIVRDGEGRLVRRIPGDQALEMLRLANAQPGTFVNSQA